MPIDGVVRRARVALVLVGAVTAIAVGAHVATSAAEVQPPAPLLQAQGCADPPPPVPVPQPAVIVPDGSGATVPVQLFIPPTVFVRVDRHGALAELMTNTGCAPRRSDRVLVETDAQHAVGAPAQLVDAVMALSFTGDWREARQWHEV